MYMVSSKDADVQRPDDLLPDMEKERLDTYLKLVELLACT